VRKDAFYFYRANWSSQPTLHLVGRRYVDRAYEVLDVKAYSNAAQAHLSLNGKEIGPAACANGICLWPGVHLQSGSNDLHATADVGGTSVSDSLQWAYSGKPGEVRIKAGDLTGYVAADQQRYGSDMYFSGGAGKGVTPPDTPVEKRIPVEAADPRLFDSYRIGQFSYRVPVPNGKYRLTLRFVEPTASAAGERVFNVSVNGKPLLKQFDVFAAAGGKLKGVEKTIQAPVRDGALLIEFAPVKGEAILSSIAIAPAN
jgi:beta-galactosidase